jgi:hypothetical protein
MIASKRVRDENPAKSDDDKVVGIGRAEDATRGPYHPPSPSLLDRVE